MKNDKKIIILLFILSSGFFSISQAEEYEITSPSRNGSGLEVRANLLASSGRFVQDLTESDPGGNTIRTYSDTSDLTSRGYALLIGYGRDYVRRGQSSFLYIGFESQKWSDEYDSKFQAFLIGAEGAIGSRSLKFIYGGEIAYGALDTEVDGVGKLSVLSGEPFIGLQWLPTEGLSVNFRVGLRGFNIEQVISASAGNIVTSKNSAYTANAQIGVGYSFY